jgi:hypothetical protein
LPAEKLRLILDWRWWWKNGTLRVGDRIAVQFLYTPQGWAPPESAGLRLTVAEAPCLLTNKVEFVLPKTVR